MYLHHHQRQTVQDFQDYPRKIVDHDCQLPLKMTSRIDYYIRNGAFVLLRRKLRRLLILDKYHPYSKYIFKSTAQMENEIIFHLGEHYYVIHPLSRARFFWEMIMMLVYLAYFLVIPAQIMVFVEQDGMIVAKSCLFVLAGTDLILWFNTGYYDRKRQRIVLKRSSIAKKYLKTHFIFDLLSLVPVKLIIDKINTVAPMTKGLYFIKLIMVVRIFRLGTFNNYVMLFFMKLRFNRFTAKALQYLIWYLLIILWSLSNFVLVKNLLEQHHKENNVDSNKGSPKQDSILGNVLNPISILTVATFISKGLFLIGYDDVDFRNSHFLDNWYFSLCIIFLIYCGGILNMIIITKVVQLIRMRAGAVESYNSINKQIGEYMSYKSLSPFLRQKVRRYVKFKFQNSVLREDEIWKSLNRLLKDDILLNTCNTLVKKVDFFKDLPMSVLLRIITKLRSEIFLPNDIIVLAGVTGNSMYFIYTGSVAVYTTTEQEICHLNEGDHFGEIALLCFEPRTATVIAVTDCELLKLNRKDFHEAIEPFPEMKRKMKELANARMKNTRNIVTSSNLHMSPTEESSFHFSL